MQVFDVKMEGWRTTIYILSIKLIECELNGSVVLVLVTVSIS